MLLLLFVFDGCETATDDVVSFEQNVFSFFGIQQSVVLDNIQLLSPPAGTLILTFNLTVCILLDMTKMPCLFLLQSSVSPTLMTTFNLTSVLGNVTALIVERTTLTSYQVNSLVPLQESITVTAVDVNGVLVFALFKAYSELRKKSVYTI